MSQKGMVNGVVVTNAIQNWNVNSETRIAAACPGHDSDDGRPQWQSDAIRTKCHGYEY